MSKRILQLLTFVALLCVSVAATAWWWNNDDEDATALDESATVIEWPDLVPADFVPFDPLADMTRDEIDVLFDGSDESNAKLMELDKLASYAPTVPELDGEQVRLAGYVVPLEFDEQTSFQEFLLVPYYGACIHTPPPPANQVVHAFADEPVTIEQTWDPVWLIGTINTETVTSNLAESGYRMTLDQVIPWEPPVEESQQ